MGKKKTQNVEHPGFDLIERGRRMLAPLFAAAEHHGAPLDAYRGEGETFAWQSSRRVRESRHLRAFLRLALTDAFVRSQDDLYIGFYLKFYDHEERSREQMSVCLTFRQSEGRWVLDYECYMGRRRSPDARRFLRRVGLRGVRKRILRAGEERKLALKFAKEFKEQVLIPRQAREKAIPYKNGDPAARH